MGKTGKKKKKAVMTIVEGLESGKSEAAAEAF